MTYLIVALIGILGGIASGLVGVGGGTIFVPLLILVCKFNPHLAIGTSLAIVIPTAIVGALTHSRAGMVDWKSALMISACAILGAWLGSKLSVKLDTLLLKRIFAVLLVFIAFKMFFSK